MNHDDEKQLRILEKLHYIATGFATAIPIFGAAYSAIGVVILLGKAPGGTPMPSRAFGWLPLTLGSFILLIGVAAVALNLLTARSLRDRKNHTLCLLTSAMNCVHFPLGTLLGTFTIIVLSRPAVRAAFPRSGSGGASVRPGPPPPPLPGGSHYPSSAGSNS